MQNNTSFKIGDYLITPLNDGTLELSAELFPSLSPDQVAECFENISQEPGPITGTLNSFLLQTGDKNILIDAGAGSLIPDTGGLLDALGKLNLAPSDIDDVLCTHLHPDHIGGLLHEGAPIFKNAALRIHVDDVDFWRSDINRANSPDMFSDFFDLASAVMSAYEAQIDTYKSDDLGLADIEAVHLPGHTPGHCGFQIGNTKDGLLIWGDIVHVQAFQMPIPNASIAFDVNPEEAARTRTGIFERALAEKMKIAGMHLDHPGIGYVTRAGSGYWLETD